MSENDRTDRLLRDILLEERKIARIMEASASGAPTAIRFTFRPKGFSYASNSQRRPVD